MLLFAQRRVRNRAEALAAERAVALQRSEGAFLAVAESARVAIVMTDARGRLTYANAAAEQMLGASREQLRGVSSMQYVADVDRDRFTDGLRKFLAGKGRIAAGAATRSWVGASRARYSRSRSRCPGTTRRKVGTSPACSSISPSACGPRLPHGMPRSAGRSRSRALTMASGTGTWRSACSMGRGGCSNWSASRHRSGAIHIDRWHALVHADDLPGVLRDLDAHLAGKRDRYVSEYRIQRA